LPKERIEFRLIRHIKEKGIKGHFEEDIYAHLRLSDSDKWETQRLIFIKALNKLGDDLNAEEEKS